MKYDSTTIILEGEPLRLSFSFSRFSGRRQEAWEYIHFGFSQDICIIKDFQNLGFCEIQGVGKYQNLGFSVIQGVGKSQNLGFSRIQGVVKC